MATQFYKPHDRIVAFATRNNISVIPNKTSIRISCLPHPALALLDAGTVPLGRHVAEKIRHSTRLLKDLYAPEELQRLEDLAVICNKFHSDYFRDPSRAHGSFHPLAGALGRSYYYGAFVPRRGEHEGLQILRALLLRAISHGRLSPETVYAVRRIRDVLTTESTDQYDDTGSSALHQQWSWPIDPDRLAALLVPYFEGETDASTVFCQQSLRPASGAIDHQLPTGTKPPTQRQPQPGQRTVPPPPLTEPTGLFSTSSYSPPPKTLDAPSADEIPPDDLEGYQRALTLDFLLDEHAPLEIERRDTEAATTFELEHATRHHLEGVLLPDTDRTLTGVETKRLWQHIVRQLESLEPTDELFIGYLCAGLMLLTGRRRDECLYAILNHTQGTPDLKNYVLRLAGDHWNTAIQALPPLRDLPTQWFLDTTSTLALPLPEPFKQWISLLSTSVSSGSIERAINTGQWQRDWKRVRRRLRRDIPRFTETRCHHSLPVALFLRTGHIREAQWISGSSLEHSTASGHYYATPAHRLQSFYSEALGSLGIVIDKPVESTGSLVGAPRAAISWQHAQVAVSGLVARTQQNVKLSKTSVQKVAEGVQVTGVYLALFYGFCTAHRFTQSIAQVTRRSIITHEDRGTHWGLCLVGDKTTHPDLDSRLCALPSLFIRQMNAYLRQLERLNRLLLRRQSDDNPLLKAVQSALSGHGPLWFLTVGNALSPTVLPLNRRALAQSWPEWEIPLPLARHLFASNAHYYDFGGSETALQMGHSIDGEAFDICDPDAPSDFAQRIANKLQSYIGALGFTCIGEAKRHDPPGPMASHTTQVIRAKHSRLKEARDTRRSQRIADPTENERERSKALIEPLFSQTTNDSHPEWLLDPTIIQSLLHQTKNESLAMQQAVRNELSKLISQLATQQTKLDKQKRRKRPYIPPIQPTTNYSAFAQVHFDAVLWAHAIETAAIKVLNQGLKENDSKAILASAPLLLALYGAGSTPSRLLKLLGPDVALHAFAGLDKGIIAEVPLGNPTDSTCETQLLTGHQVALVTYMKRHIEGSRTLPQVESALKSQKDLRNFVDSSSKTPLASVLTLIGLARQFYIPGTRSGWERGLLDTVGPSLDRLAPLFSTAIEPVTQRKCKPPVPHNTMISRRAGLAEYRRLRKLGYRLTVNYSKTTTRKAISVLREQWHTNLGSTHLITLLADLLIYLRTERKLADSTAYEYLTAIGARLIRSVGAVDISGIDESMLEEALRDIAVTVRTGAHRKGLGAVTSATHYFADILRRVDIELDLGRIFDGLELNVFRNPGYLATQAEINRIMNELSARTNNALETFNTSPKTDDRVIAEVGSRVQMVTGLRVGEAAGLMQHDVIFDVHGMSVNVHAKRRRLKTLASHRVVVVPLDPPALRRLERLYARLTQRLHEGKPGLLQLGQLPDTSIITRTLTSRFRQAACKTITGQAARSHIARHNAASVAVLATHSDSYVRAMQSSLPIATQETSKERLMALSRLPKRMQFRYLSRQLGHGTPQTTLVWYAHTIPLLCIIGGPWRGLDRRTEAKLVGQNVRTIELWRARNTDSNANDVPNADSWSPRWLPVTLHSPTAANEQEKYGSNKTNPDWSSLSANLVADVALLIRAEIDNTRAAHHVGLSHSTYYAVNEILAEFDRAYALHYLTGRRHRARSHQRVPRAHSLQPFFSKLDALMNDGTLHDNVLRHWAHLQLQQDKKTLVFTPDTQILAEILSTQKRVKTALTDMSSADISTLHLQPADRQLILLVSLVLTWFKRS